MIIENIRLAAFLIRHLHQKISCEIQSEIEKFFRL